MPIRPDPFGSLLSGRRQAAEEFRENARFQSQQLNDSINRAITLAQAPLQLATLQEQLEAARVANRQAPIAFQQQTELRQEQIANQREERLERNDTRDIRTQSLQLEYDAAKERLDALKRSNSPEAVAVEKDLQQLDRKLQLARIEAQKATTQAAIAAKSASLTEAASFQNRHGVKDPKETTINSGGGLVTPDPLNPNAPIQLSPFVKQELKDLRTRAASGKLPPDALRASARIALAKDPKLDDDQINKNADDFVLGSGRSIDNIRRTITERASSRFGNQFTPNTSIGGIGVSLAPGPLNSARSSGTSGQLLQDFKTEVKETFAFEINSGLVDIADVDNIADEAAIQFGFTFEDLEQLQQRQQSDPFGTTTRFNLGNF